MSEPLSDTDTDALNRNDNAALPIETALSKGIKKGYLTLSRKEYLALPEEVKQEVQDLRVFSGLQSMVAWWFYNKSKTESQTPWINTDDAKEVWKKACELAGKNKKEPNPHSQEIAYHCQLALYEIKMEAINV